MPHGAQDWLVTPEFKIREQLLFEQFCYTGYANETSTDLHHVFIKLHNPADSGVVCRPFHIGYKSVKAGTIFLGVSAVTGSVISSSIFNLYLDGPDGNCYFRGGHIASITINSLYVANAPADTWDEFSEIDVVIPPDNHLTVWMLATLNTLEVTMKWEEIPL